MRGEGGERSLEASSERRRRKWRKTTEENRLEKWVREVEPLSL